MSVRFSLLLGLACLNATLGAQAPASDRSRVRAEVVARQFFNAVSHGRWIDAAQLLDLTWIELNRRSLFESARRPMVHHAPTLQDLMRSDPDMPRAVAEYELARLLRHRGEARAEHFSSVFADVSDTTMLVRLSPLELGARWLQGQDMRYQLRRATLRSPSCRRTPGVSAAIDAAERLPERFVIGAIEVGDSAYVVHSDTSAFRTRMDGTAPKVAVLVWGGDRWRISPDYMLIRQGFGASVMCEVPRDSVPPS
jgi:hypothetical protein